ncbi:hypothetical protein GCM10023085_80580 [Actinomadura viridis]
MDEDGVRNQHARPTNLYFADVDPGDAMACVTQVPRDRDAATAPDVTSNFGAVLTRRAGSVALVPQLRGRPSSASIGTAADDGRR